ncbi:brassinosteroid-responsive RING protein 1-like [Cryptomeria japonica]|uniref:brassinosteroid-responsive RING protein 1-like n=1 Tax=Cryptomeria japonica TaxID=3369 RepID=UPI0027DA9B7D|nr:brassinosteroid-responsive RING protein 1-like [Cryptomeria japonica]
MGFPVNCRNIAIPRVLLYLASAMLYIKTGFCCFLSALGLSEPPEDEIYLWQELQQIPSDISASSSGEMIKNILPIITFRNVADKFAKISEDFVCAICLRSFEENDEIRELYNCCHIFHRNCLDKWIDSHQDTCPFCRCPLLPPIERVYK